MNSRRDGGLNDSKSDEESDTLDNETVKMSVSSKSPIKAKSLEAQYGKYYVDHTADLQNWTIDKGIDQANERLVASCIIERTIQMVQSLESMISEEYKNSNLMIEEIISISGINYVKENRPGDQEFSKEEKLKLLTEGKRVFKSDIATQEVSGLHFLGSVLKKVIIRTR